MDKSETSRVPSTAYQQVLYVIGYPWLALVRGPVKPGVGLLIAACWMGALALAPQNVALLGVIAPIVVLIVSLTSSVLLVLETEFLETKSRLAHVRMEIQQRESQRSRERMELALKFERLEREQKMQASTRASTLEANRKT